MASSAEMEGWLMRRESASHAGRHPSTTRDHITDVALELFAERGFDQVSADDVAAAAGISPRTLFRYYASKNAIPWGAFDVHLAHLRALLGDMDPAVPIGAALRTALLAFNDFDDTELPRHRRRMRVILQTDALQAYSMTMYAEWRAVVAAFVASRLGVQAGDLVPQTVAWTVLGAGLAAYGQWLADERTPASGRDPQSLAQALGEAFDIVGDGLHALGSSVG